MNKLHELNTSYKDVQEISAEVNTFQIFPYNKKYKIGDYLLYRALKKGEPTSFYDVKRIIYTESVDNWLVVSLGRTPAGIQTYLEMSDEEKTAFKEAVSYIHLNGYYDEALYQKAFKTMTGALNLTYLSDSDQQWYMELWDEDVEEINA